MTTNDSKPRDDFDAVLARCRGGDGQACEEVFTRVYAELRTLAAGYMRRERPDHTLQPTALVHEVIAKLLAGSRVEWLNRTHVFAVVARQMRLVLTDYGRRRSTRKRRDERGEMPADGGAAPSAEVEKLLAVHEALNDLAAANPRQARIAELHTFVELTFPEIAEETGLSEATVKREWKLAKEWLSRRLTADNALEPEA